MRFKKCLSSNSYIVLEKFLYSFNNKRIYSFLIENNEIRREFLPNIFPTLLKNSIDHWSMYDVFAYI